MFKLSSRLRKVVFNHKDEGSKGHRKYHSHPDFPKRDSRSRSHARNVNDEGQRHKI